jgi:hypothetical protein
VTVRSVRKALKDITKKDRNLMDQKSTSSWQR